MGIWRGNFFLGGKGVGTKNKFGSSYPHAESPCQLSLLSAVERLSVIELMIDTGCRAGELARCEERQSKRNI